MAGYVIQFFVLGIAVMAIFAIVIYQMIRTGTMELSVDTGKEGAEKYLDRLRERTKGTLSKLDLEKADGVGWAFIHEMSMILSKYRTFVGLKNEKGEDALIAVGTYKNYKPFEAVMLAQFDDHKLKVELVGDEYEYRLDGKVIAYHPFKLFMEALENALDNKAAKNCLMDSNHKILFWHNRPDIHLNSASLGGTSFSNLSIMKYSFFSDEKMTKKVADLSRESGREIADGISDDTSATFIKFAKRLSIEQKAAILGFLLVDLTINV